MASNAYLDKQFLTRDPWQDINSFSYKVGKKPPYLNISERDMRTMVDDLAYSSPNWRGVSTRDLTEVIEVVMKHLPLGSRNDGVNYEDLFHQAMACLEAAYEGETVEGDAAELLNAWEKMLKTESPRDDAIPF